MLVDWQVKMRLLLSRPAWRHTVWRVRTGTRALSVLGGLWLLAEIVLRAVDAALKLAPETSKTAVTEVELHGLAMMVLLAVLVSVLASIPRRFKATISGTDLFVEVMIGDMLAEPGPNVIAATTTFDCDVESGVIAADSLQGQFTTAHYRDSKSFELELRSQLQGLPTPAAQHIRTHLPVYERGDCVRICAKDASAYFFALTAMDLDLQAGCTAEEFRSTLPRLWEAIRRDNDNEPTCVPLLGTGRGRLNRQRTQVAKDIVLSFVAASRDRQVVPGLRLVVSPRDVLAHDIDIVDIHDFVSQVCRYR